MVLVARVLPCARAVHLRLVLLLNSLVVAVRRTVLLQLWRQDKALASLHRGGRGIEGRRCGRSSQLLQLLRNTSFRHRQGSPSGSELLHVP